MNHLLTVYSVVLSVLFLASSPRIDAAIYKWKDDKGQIHYSAIAPNNTVKKDNIEAEIARISQVTIAPAKSIVADDNEANTDDSSNTPSTSYCKQQQSIIKSLESNPYVKWKVDDKETLLEGEEKAAQVEKIKQDVKKYCSKESTSE